LPLESVDVGYQVPPSGGFLEIGNAKLEVSYVRCLLVPPSGGFLEIGNRTSLTNQAGVGTQCSPFGGIPRNWKQPSHQLRELLVLLSSPFGGIPRNWKLLVSCLKGRANNVPPSGGSLEIGNYESHPHYYVLGGLFPLRGDP